MLLLNQISVGYITSLTINILLRFIPSCIPIWNASCAKSFRDILITLACEYSFQNCSNGLLRLMINYLPSQHNIPKLIPDVVTLYLDYSSSLCNKFIIFTCKCKYVTLVKIFNNFSVELNNHRETIENIITVGHIAHTKKNAQTLT